LNSKREPFSAPFFLLLDFSLLKMECGLVMNEVSNRSTGFYKLLVQDLRVRWAYSLVVIFVIAALFSTPLILGSIKNRVYVAVKEQVEKENNAREITIQQAENVPLDGNFLSDLSSKYPNQLVGNMKSVVMVEGPEDVQIQTLQTLVPDDPRTQALQITPTIPADFGLFDLVVSDHLGESLYGAEKWHQLWNQEASRLTGKSLTLAINDIPLRGQFRVVARQTMPGRKIYASEQLGMCLKKYAIGLGCQEVGLPMVPEQVQYSLPKFQTRHCLLEFPNEQCDSAAQAKITKRLRAENFQVEKTQNMVADISRFQVTLTQINELNGQVEPTKGDCEQRLYHHLQACPYAIITSKISLKKVDLEQSGNINTIQLSGISPDSYDFLPGIDEMTNKWGGRKLDFWTDGISEDGIEMVAPYSVNTQLGAAELRVTGDSGESRLPAFITAYYQCPTGMNCPFYTKPNLVFRLQNMMEGTAIFKHNEDVPAIFYPTEQQQRIDYDEIFFYANQVEEVEGLHEELKKALPGYNVQYNIYAIDNLKRQDQRLTTLFKLTLWLSVVFILLAVGALAKINIDKRRRQMAQLFLLGYSKLFVSLLLVCEYVLLTVLASILAIGVGWTVLEATVYYLQISTGQDTTEFATIVNAMSLDISAFSMVFLTVVLVTTVVAAVAAILASKIDPVELLD